LRVLVVGGCMVDVKATANDAPEPGTSNPATVHIAPGGVGRNIAESVKRLGADVVLASAAGNDPFADYLEEGLEAMGIEAHILRTGATAFDVGWFETSGEMVMGLCDIGGLEQIEAEALLAPVGPLGTYDAAVLEANLPATVLADIAAEMRAASVPYALEPVSIPKAPRLAGALDGAFLLKPCAPRHRLDGRRRLLFRFRRRGRPPRGGSDGSSRRDGSGGRSARGRTGRADRGRAPCPVGASHAASGGPGLLDSRRRGPVLEPRDLHRW